MNIFISWSGSTSRGLAGILKEWLPTVLPYARPWLSSEDIRKGKPWDPALTKQLAVTSYSIVWVTMREAAKAPWVNFEAGAVSKYIEHTHVSPLLVRVSPENLAGLPLARFQCTEFTKTDVSRLLRSINEAAGSPVSREQLDRNLRNTWWQLQENVRKLELSENLHRREDDDEYYDDDDDDGRNYVILEEIAEHILDAVARADPHSVTVDEILPFFIHENRVRVKHYLDHLAELGLLRHHRHDEQVKDSYSVTRAGRKYWVDHDLG